MVATAAVLARSRGLEISTTETHPRSVSVTIEVERAGLTNWRKRQRVDQYPEGTDGDEACTGSRVGCLEPDSTNRKVDAAHRDSAPQYQSASTHTLNHVERGDDTDD